MTATAAAPQWDMYAHTTERLDFSAATHVQQGFTTSGSLRVGAPDEDEYRLDGVGFKDHSSGPRSFEKWYGHRFFLIVAEDWVCHAIGMYTPDGQATAPSGALIRDGLESKLTRFELPLMADAEGGPVEGRLLIATESGEVLEFETELLHALPMTITVDNDNINGVDWELEGDPIVITEGKGKLTAADGSVAYCFHERSASRSLLDRPT